MCFMVSWLRPDATSERRHRRGGRRRPDRATRSEPPQATRPGPRPEPRRGPQPEPRPEPWTEPRPAPRGETGRDRGNERGPRSPTSENYCRLLNNNQIASNEDLAN